MGNIVNISGFPLDPPVGPRGADACDFAALVDLLGEAARRLAVLTAAPVPREGTVVLHLDEASQAVHLALLGLIDCLPPGSRPRDRDVAGAPVPVPRTVRPHPIGRW